MGKEIKVHYMFKQYKQEVARYGKKDALIALGLYVYACVILFLFAVLSRQPNMPLGAFTQTIISTSLIIVPCFAMILFRKQSIASIGVHTKNLWSALRIGLVLCALILLMNVFLPAFFGSFRLFDFSHMVRVFFLVLFVVFMEDTLFTGYLQTRIYGLIKNDIAAVLTVAFLFAFSHVVTIVGMVGISGFSTVISHQMWFWILTHIIWNLIFRRYFSIIPITMFHAVWNFGNVGIFSTTDGHNMFGGGIIESYVLLFVVIIWLVFSYLMLKKDPPIFQEV